MNSADLSPHYALLGFLYLQPMHGYELHKQFQANLREVWRVSQSQAYTILKRLEKDAWVRSTSLHPPEGKRPGRSCFELTPTGRAAFENWLFTPTPSSARALRVEFLTRLFFASRIGGRLTSRLLQEQAAATREDLAGLNRRLEQIPAGQIYNRLGIELRIRQLFALLEWMDSCEQTLQL
jgi:PadR family transcriptional regulator, regulatory protein AphA